MSLRLGGGLSRSEGLGGGGGRRALEAGVTVGREGDEEATGCRQWIHLRGGGQEGGDVRRMKAGIVASGGWLQRPRAVELLGWKVGRLEAVDGGPIWSLKKAGRGSGSGQSFERRGVSGTANEEMRVCLEVR